MIAELIRSIRMIFLRLFRRRIYNVKLILLDKSYIRFSDIKSLSLLKAKIENIWLYIPVERLGKPIEIIDMGEVVIRKKDEIC